MVNIKAYLLIADHIRGDFELKEWCLTAVSLFLLLGTSLNGVWVLAYA